LLRETVRDSKDISPLLSGSLARAQITGCDYPQAFLSSILRRISADRNVNYLRVSGIKAVLTRNYAKTLIAPIPMSLDTERNDVPYLLGRLFAALEKAQRDSNPGLENTVREKYFTSASATPAAIFPRMLQLCQHHLRKLKGEKMGLAINDDKLIGSIMETLGSFPQRLSLQEQGLFAIGYYHQRNSFYQKKNRPEDGDTVIAEPVTAQSDD
jgi:CRISPR-associated protein Csd1